MNSKFMTVIGRTTVVFFIIAGILSFASLHSLTLANAWLYVWARLPWLRLRELSLPIKTNMC